MNAMSLLSVNDLHVAFGETEVLRGVSFDLAPGETLGVVGESGCGKSMTGFAIMGMLQRPGRVTQGSILLEGRELAGLPEKEYRQIRGQEIALVMQDPFTSLNPMMRVGDQIAESYRLHQGLSMAEGRVKAIEMLDKVGVPSPAESAQKFPHQMSGGQKQRVVIAMAFACSPKVLIADEPTTALDVTLQAQILRLLRELQEKEGTGVILISHDIGAIASALQEEGDCKAWGGRVEAEATPTRFYMSCTLRKPRFKNKERSDRLSTILTREGRWSCHPTGNRQPS